MKNSKLNLLPDLLVWEGSIFVFNIQKDFFKIKYVEYLNSQVPHLYSEVVQACNTCNTWSY